MTITLDISGKNMKLKVLKGPSFALDRDKIKSLSSKKPIYRLQDEVSKFSHWEVPVTEFGNLLGKIPKGEILFLSDQAKELLDSYELASSDLMSLPPFTGDIPWKRTPRYPEQELAIRLNKSKNRVLLAFSCGMGKSFIALMRSVVLGAKKILIVGPSKNNFPTWRAEVTKTLDASIVKYHGTPAQRKKLREAIDSEIVYTTYSIAQELKNHKFDLIIADEAHNICHRKTKAFQGLEAVSKANPEAGLILLSGTPILHKPRDLWAPTHLINPQIAGDEYAWKNRYEKVTRMMKKQVPIKTPEGFARDGEGKIRYRTLEIPLETRPQNLDELTERIKSFTFRFKGSNYLNFEDKIELQIVEMTSRQKELYRQAKDELFLDLSEKQLKLGEKLGRITRFLQICEGSFNLDPAWQDSGKLNYLFDELDSATDKRIVWSRFLPSSEVLYKRYGDRAVIYNGSLSQTQRNVSIWNFQGCETKEDLAEWKKYNKTSFEPGQAQFLFGVIDKGASAGLNLNSCSKQYFTSFSWNGSINEQTAARIKRLSQEADEVYTEIILSEAPKDFEENAFKLTLRNYLTTIDILDGKEDNSFTKINDLINLL
jgi:hypothetical protein